MPSFAGWYWQGKQSRVRERFRQAAGAMKATFRQDVRSDGFFPMPSRNTLMGHYDDP